MYNKAPQQKESKKKSTKPKYCGFTGKVGKPGRGGKVKCPECGRKLIPHTSTCTGGREDIDFACCVYYTLHKHKRKR